MPELLQKPNKFVVFGSEDEKHFIIENPLARALAFEPDTGAANEAGEAVMFNGARLDGASAGAGKKTATSTAATATTPWWAAMATTLWLAMPAMTR